MVASSVADVGAESERRAEAQVDYDGGPRSGSLLPRTGLLWLLRPPLRLRSGRSHVSGGVLLGLYAVGPVLLVLLGARGRRGVSHRPPPQARVLLGSAGDGVIEGGALEWGSGRPVQSICITLNHSGIHIYI